MHSHRKPDLQKWRRPDKDVEKQWIQFWILSMEKGSVHRPTVQSYHKG